MVRGEMVRGEMVRGEMVRGEMVRGEMSYCSFHPSLLQLPFMIGNYSPISLFKKIPSGDNRQASYRHQRCHVFHLAGCRYTVHQR